MRLSERAVFYALLERADNATCVIPSRMTPSLVQLAEACCCAKSTAALALEHLEAHGWVIRTRTPRPGRGHKTVYCLDHGWLCPDDCPLRRRPRAQKGSDSRTLPLQKGSDRRTGKGSDWHIGNRRSTPVLAEGISEGEGSGGLLVRAWPDPDRAWLDSRTYSGTWDQWEPGTIGAEVNR